ncbi:hypothetical protein HY497_01425 [Candidatus Woesearchaeota archaeon]|nr:hypothetical protein [Candidatus Woesearchaeota archaeon]
MLDYLKEALEKINPVLNAQRLAEMNATDKDLRESYQRKGVEHLVASGDESTYLFFEVAARQGEETLSYTFLRGFEKKSIFDIIVARDFMAELHAALPGATLDETRFPCHSATVRGSYDGADITVTIHAQGRYRLEAGDVILLQDRCRLPPMPDTPDMKKAFDEAMTLLNGRDVYAGRQQKQILLPVKKNAVSSECARC